MTIHYTLVLTTWHAGAHACVADQHGDLVGAGVSVCVGFWVLARNRAQVTVVPCGVGQPVAERIDDGHLQTGTRQGSRACT